MKKELTHILGGFLMISALFHSKYDFLPLLTVVPLVLVSYGAHKEDERLQLVGLITATLLSGFFLDQYSLGDFYGLLFFITSFVLPFGVYWRVVLSFELHLDLRPSLVASLYFVLVISLFYTMIYLLDAQGYLLSAGNYAPQALVMGAFALVVLVPFHLFSDR